ncbi:hypothetical protein E6O75_ATG05332 [Venturia nashicola]|uniref:Uncharacterized protein n=1 Tax=Venturia nashicola TaxID=86259 RepID=A0A4Z1P021_9PEZI|nr:hypothetical protein E6O75_ATG05332 [Venturia nashicola]
MVSHERVPEAIPEAWENQTILAAGKAGSQSGAQVQRLRPLDMASHVASQHPVRGLKYVLINTGSPQLQEEKQEKEQG